MEEVVVTPCHVRVVLAGAVAAAIPSLPCRPRRPVTPPFERRPDVRAMMVVAVALRQRLPPPRAGRARCMIPQTGPAVIASNHTSGLDPIMIQASCPRPITWVMTAEFYDLPSLKWFLEHVEMIRIDRTTRDTVGVVEGAGQARRRPGRRRLSGRPHRDEPRPDAVRRRRGVMACRGRTSTSTRSTSTADSGDADARGVPARRKRRSVAWGDVVPVRTTPAIAAASRATSAATSTSRSAA